MRDLSLHVLDLVENSIRANASAVRIIIAADSEHDTLKILVEDNGPGLSVPPEVATDPFYTTKQGKRVGLGLALFKEAVEQAGGALTLRRSDLGGLAVEATMQLNHIDRSPLGDIAAAVCAIVCTNPDLNLWCTLRAGKQERTVNVSDVAEALPDGQRCALTIARQMSERIRTALATLQLTA